MKASEFCYWLQGYFELAEFKNGLSPKQAHTVQRHLNLVFAHELDSDADGGDSEKKSLLQAIHDEPAKPDKPIKPEKPFTDPKNMKYRC